jgi:hypothetical protein
LLLRRILPFLALATIPFCLLCLAISVSDLHTYPAADLRAKVAGARLLAAGQNPYNLNPDSQPNQYFKSPAFPTYTPVLLALYVPLSALPYETQRTIYFCLDWLLAGATFYLFQRSFCESLAEKYFCWIAYCSFIVCSYAFRFHLERGQYYMLVLLLLCHTAASIEHGQSGWLACLPTALLLVVRPTYCLMLVAALLCLNARKWVLRVSALAAAMFLATLRFGGIQRWFGFMETIRARQAQYLEGMTTLCCKQHLSLRFLPPTIIENIDFSRGLQGHALNGTFIGLCSFPFGLVSRRLLFLCGYIAPRQIEATDYLFMTLVLAGGIGVAFMARQRVVDRKILIAYVVVWPLIFEIFGPERQLYTSVVEFLSWMLVLLDRDALQPRFAGSGKFRFLAAILVFGALPPLVVQLTHKPLVEGVANFFTLLVLPVAIAAFCVYAILRSPKRNQDSPAAS